MFRGEPGGTAGSVSLGPSSPSSGVAGLGIGELKHTTARLLSGIADTELVSSDVHGKHAGH